MLKEQQIPVVGSSNSPANRLAVWMSSDHSDSLVFRFEDFHIRTDKTNERVTNSTPWNWIFVLETGLQ